MTYEEILAYLESLKGTPVDLQAQMQGNPNEVNPVARGGSNVAWGNVPGLEQFYSYDQANNQENFNLSAALPEIQRLGYQVMQAEDPGAETMASWVAGPDGKPIAQSAYLTGTNDDAFKLAALAAMGVTGANILGAGMGAGGAAQAGGAAAAPTGMTAEQAAMLAANSPVGNAGGLAAWEAAQAGGAAAGAAGAAGGAGGLINAAAPAAVGGLLSGISPTLLQLGGAALGAASSQDQEQTTTTKNEPWGPAQDWIKSNIAAGQALQQKYTDQPFSPGQQTAYGNLYGLLNSYNTEMLPGLLGNANAMSQGYDRYAPKETRSKPKFGAVGSTWAPGLLKFGG
ncbi:MAG: hypothetical protein IPK42_10790 [Betaproteobacteria bacterium]|nr:hypothetical protein [Betaproteobacteria bacterium]